MNNPYHAPTADLSQANHEDDGYLPSFFSLSGRIGRVRYFAYTLAPSFLLMFVAGMFMAVLVPRMGNQPLLVLAMYIPVFILLFIMGVRRLNDANLSGWLSLLSLVPFVNVLFGLALLFIPGSQGANRYGPQPRKNTTAVIVMAWVGPVILIAMIGIMAAVAIPAYQGYVKKAKANQETTAPAPLSQQAPE